MKHFLYTTAQLTPVELFTQSQVALLGFVAVPSLFPFIVQNSPRDRLTSCLCCVTALRPVILGMVDLSLDPDQDNYLVNRVLYSANTSNEFIYFCQIDGGLVPLGEKHG